MQRFNSVSRSTRVVIALALAAVTLVSVNLFATESMQQWRADTTEGGLYTISAATRKVLSHLQDPITLRFYYSREIGNKVPTYAQYASRIRNLLSLYQSLSGGKLRVEYYDPKPFTEDEDRAVAAGLQGVSLGTGQTSVYLGLVGSNLTDNQQVIPFFNLDRSDFLEYDLTRLIYKLADPKRKVVGLLTSLPLAGSMNPQTGQPIPPWLVYQQMSDFFTVKAVSADMKTVPRRCRHAAGGVARQAHRAGRLCHRPVRACGQTGDGVRRCLFRDRPGARLDPEEGRCAGAPVQVMGRHHRARQGGGRHRPCAARAVRGSGPAHCHQLCDVDEFRQVELRSQRCHLCQCRPAGHRQPRRHHPR